MAKNSSEGDPTSLTMIGGAILSAETIKALPEIIKALGEAGKNIGEAIKPFWANKNKIEEQKEIIEKLTKELQNIQAGIKNSGIYIMQYNDLYELSTSTEDLTEILNEALRDFTGVWKLHEATPILPQINKYFQNRFHDVTDASRNLQTSFRGKKSSLYQEDYDDINDHISNVNGFIPTIEDYLKNNKYDEAANDISKLIKEYSLIKEIIKERLDLISKGLILAEPQ